MSGIRRLPGRSYSGSLHFLFLLGRDKHPESGLQRKWYLTINNKSRSIITISCTVRRHLWTRGDAHRLKQVCSLKMRSLSLVDGFQAHKWAPSPSTTLPIFRALFCPEHYRLPPNFAVKFFCAPHPSHGRFHCGAAETSGRFDKNNMPITRCFCKRKNVSGQSSSLNGPDFALMCFRSDSKDFEKRQKRSLPLAYGLMYSVSMRGKCSLPELSEYTGPVL